MSLCVRTVRCLEKKALHWPLCAHTKRTLDFFYLHKRRRDDDDDDDDFVCVDDDFWVFFFVVFEKLETTTKRWVRLVRPKV